MGHCLCGLAVVVLAVAIFADAAHGQPPAKVLYADPLPPGAVARLGTLYKNGSDPFFNGLLGRIGNRGGR
jgi:hypothetical protein